MAIIVPALHPAALLRGRDEESGLSKFEQTTIADIGKAIRLSRERPQWDERAIWERDSVGRLKNLFPTPDEVIEFCRNALGHPVATDTETTGEQVMVAQMLCAGFASANGTVMCVPFLRRGGSKYWAPHDEQRVRWAVGQLLASRDTLKIFHNKEFDKIVYWLNGLPVDGPCGDTMQMHHVIDSELPHALGYCMTRYLDARYHKDDVKGDEGWLYLDDAQLRSYNLRDCIGTRELFPVFSGELTALGPKLWALYEQECRLTAMMARATVRGLAVDFWRRDCERPEIPILDKKGKVTGYQKGLGPRLRDQMWGALGVLRQLAGSSAFDPMKPTQLKELLFSRLKFPVVKLSESGLHPSTDKEAMVLLALAAGTPEQKYCIKALADFKQGQKFLSTFVEGLKVTGDGRFHPSWRMLTTSGRFASNAQNWRKNIKAIFCAGGPRYAPTDVSDEEFSGADLKQAEMRGIAYDANDTRLLQMYQQDLNVHTVNLAMSLKVRPPIGHGDLDLATQKYIEQHLPLQFPGWDFSRLVELDGNPLKAGRTLIKNDGFGRNYGGEDEVVFSIMRSARDPDTNELLFPNLKRSEVEANGILWKRLNVGIIRWWSALQAKVKAKGYYQCPISGRIRWFRAGQKKNDILGTPIQMMIASFMNERMLEIQDVYDRETGGQASVVQQVHDSLNVANPKGYSARAAQVMTAALSRPIALPGHPNATFPPDKVLHGSHLSDV